MGSLTLAIPRGITAPSDGLGAAIDLDASGCAAGVWGNGYGLGMGALGAVNPVFEGEAPWPLAAAVAWPFVTACGFSHCRTICWVRDWVSRNWACRRAVSLANCCSASRACWAAGDALGVRGGAVDPTTWLGASFTDAATDMTVAAELFTGDAPFVAIGVALTPGRLFTPAGAAGVDAFTPTVDAGSSDLVLLTGWLSVDWARAGRGAGRVLRWLTPDSITAILGVLRVARPS